MEPGHAAAVLATRVLWSVSAAADAVKQGAIAGRAADYEVWPNG